MTKSTNGHGGHREGAGRPPDPETFANVSPEMAPKLTAEERAEAMAQFLHAVALSNEVDMKHRVAAAKSLISPQHAKKMTKKEEAAESAKTAVTGRFGVRQPPKLVTG
jgi:hypothetical protein